MARFNTEHDAAGFLLARHPGIPRESATLASLLRGESEAMGWDLSAVVEAADDHLAGRAGPAGNLSPRSLGDVRRAVAGYRPLAVWCWIARYEAALAIAVDYIALVAENDGAAYAGGKLARAAVRRAWDDAMRRAAEGEPVEQIAGLTFEEIRDAAVARVAGGWQS